MVAETTGDISVLKGPRDKSLQADLLHGVKGRDEFTRRNSPPLDSRNG